MQAVFVPDSRLRSAIPFLKRGGRVADIGTDHAYLPIYLIHKGIVSHALACDINAGPLCSARTNISAAGLDSFVETMQTDGLHGVEEYAPDDILIFGMGGELIARILSEATWLCDRDVGLILQPMSRASVLRRWLLENGFTICGEALTFEDKYYQTLYARRGKDTVPYTEEELLIGRHNLSGKSPLLEGFLKHEMSVLERIICEKSKSSRADVAWETNMMTLLRQRLEELEQ